MEGGGEGWVEGAKEGKGVCATKVIKTSKGSVCILKQSLNA